MNKNLDPISFINANKALVDYDEIAARTARPNDGTPYSRNTVKSVLNGARTNQHIVTVAVEYLQEKIQSASINAKRLKRPQH